MRTRGKKVNYKKLAKGQESPEQDSNFEMENLDTEDTNFEMENLDTEDTNFGMENLDTEDTNLDTLISPDDDKTETLSHEHFIDDWSETETMMKTASQIKKEQSDSDNSENEKSFELCITDSDEEKNPQELDDEEPASIYEISSDTDDEKSSSQMKPTKFGLVGNYSSSDEHSEEDQPKPIQKMANDKKNLVHQQKKQQTPATKHLPLSKSESKQQTQHSVKFSTMKRMKQNDICSKDYSDETETPATKHVPLLKSQSKRQTQDSVKFSTMKKMKPNDICSKDYSDNKASTSKCFLQKKNVNQHLLLKNKASTSKSYLKRKRIVTEPSELSCDSQSESDNDYEDTQAKINCLQTKLEKLMMELQSCKKKQRQTSKHKVPSQHCAQDYEQKQVQIPKKRCQEKMASPHPAKKAKFQTRTKQMTKQHQSTPAKFSKQPTSMKPKQDDKIEEETTDELLNALNQAQVFSSRDLQINRKYKLMNLKITEENGFNGPYKKATAKLLDPTRPSGTITIALPSAVVKLEDTIIQQLQKRIEDNQSPHYVVKSITTRNRSDGKGSYDVVDFKWV